LAGQPALPAYRLKKKLAVCSLCAGEPSCDGFFGDYLKLFGEAEVRPIAAPPVERASVGRSWPGD